MRAREGREPRRWPWRGAALVATIAMGGCTLLAPSDQDLMGGLRDGSANDSGGDDDGSPDGSHGDGASDGNTFDVPRDIGPTCDPSALCAGGTCCAVACNEGACASCADNGVRCSGPTACCSHQCTNGVCGSAACTPADASASDASSDADAGTPVDAGPPSCGSPSACCTGTCIAGSCQACKQSGASCALGTDCCSLNCNLVTHVCEPCIDVGGSCRNASPAACCTGACRGNGKCG